MKLDAKALRVSEPTGADLQKIKRRGIYIICDNILDTYNIGSIFRLADAVVAKKIYLCGQTETPPNSRISKASVGTDKWVPWQYASTAVEATEELRRRHSRLDRESRSIDSRFLASLSRSGRGNDREREIKIVAIEQGKGSVDFRIVRYQEPVAFLVGNETQGVSKKALKMVDEIVEIPMFGVNK